MSSLSSEYRKRHELNFIWLINESVCFFNEYNRPAMVALISSNSKPFKSCQHCGGNSTLILELFEPNKDIGFILKEHFHVQPDCDLLEIFKSKNINYTPFAAKSQREIELWLWEFFFFHNQLRYSKSWKAWEARQKDTGEHLAISQMVWCSLNFSDIYENYYETYKTFLAGRQYLLSE